MDLNKSELCSRHQLTTKKTKTGLFCDSGCFLENWVVINFFLPTGPMKLTLLDLGDATTIEKLTLAVRFVEA